MNSVVLLQLTNATRHHRRRLVMRALSRAAHPAMWGGTVALLILVVVIQLWSIPARYWLTGAVGLSTLVAWGGVWWWQQRRAASIWLQLDHHYGWEHSVSTAAQFARAHQHAPFAAAQYARTLALVAATPARILVIWEKHMRWAVLAWSVAMLLAASVPTPFDAQIALQTKVQQLAQSVAQQVTTLPQLDASMDAARLAAALGAQRDAQQLVAQLDVATQQVAVARQQAQQVAAYASQLARAPNRAAADAVMARAATALTATEFAALQDAQRRAEAGDANALDQLQATAQQQRQAADAWQQTLTDAKQQAVQLAASAQPNQPQPAASDAAQIPDGAQAQTTAAQPATNAAQSGMAPDSSTAVQQPQVGGNGAGRGTGSDASMQLFVPQLAANTTITLQSPQSSATGETTLTDGGGLDAPALQYQYADVVNQAQQQAAQAIADAHIPWTAQQTVRDYFTVLQESTP